MKKIIRKNGYSTETAKQYIDFKLPIYSLSSKLDPQMKFEDGQPTGEIISHKAWFSQLGLPPFQVKFESEVSLPTYMSIVEFKDLEACEVGYNVYFRAGGIKEVK
ncbi:hypothetical protein MXZ21_07680 [Streptococcus uberis]|uniref:hypothetical protein n=1 Tax=Streptococcus uberis TaxID=1349 RepID=UPI001FF141FE|nr:hypothetical protein [Streptococcus uberis]MCK1191657.1 hypothetical protein [Streptococcus uberis]MCK1209455.1 hypothetical protein [Streptococcus uberis]